MLNHPARPTRALLNYPENASSRCSSISVPYTGLGFLAAGASRPGAGPQAAGTVTGWPRDASGRLIAALAVPANPR
jgi:hypothetical protein